MNRRESLKTGASVIAGLALIPDVLASATVSERQAVDSFWEVIRTRRSVRNYQPTPVPEEDLLKIVDAARMAPCSANAQPWKFIIIRDKKQIDALKNECTRKIETELKKNTNLEGDAFKEELQKRVDRRLTGRFSAPAFIVVLTDNERQYPDYNKHDGPLAAGYLLLAARALEYGSVYMTDSIPAEVTKKVLNIPDRYTQVCVTPIGVPVEWPTIEKKKLEDFVVRESF
jgi:nitroreductase